MPSMSPQIGTEIAPPRVAHHAYRFGSFELNTRSGDLHKNGNRVRLQEQPRRILLLLIEHAGDLVTREELHQALWSADTYVDYDIGLNAAMRKLRIALGDRVKQPHYIETVSRRGYRFAAPVAVFEVGLAQPPSQLFPAGLWLVAIDAMTDGPSQPKL